MGKNKKSKQQIPVYATEHDLKHPTILRLAYLNGVISQDDYQELLKMGIDNITLKTEWVVAILRDYFGFADGVYDEHDIEGEQLTRITRELVSESKRYCGCERLDSEWIESGLASSDAKELYKFGEVLKL